MAERKAAKRKSKQAAIRDLEKEDKRRRKFDAKIAGKVIAAGGIGPGGKGRLFSAPLIKGARPAAMVGEAARKRLRDQLQKEDLLRARKRTLAAKKKASQASTPADKGIAASRADRAKALKRKKEDEQMMFRRRKPKPPSLSSRKKK